MHARSSVCTVLALTVLALAACGGGPSGPSAAEGVSLDGTAIGMPGLAATGFSASARGADPDVITVTCVENLAITTTVGPDGRFTLRGLPEGGFHLAFSSNGTPLGTLYFDEVKPNQQITVTVDLSGSTVTLVEQRRNGIGHGDLEIEGLVEQVLELDVAGDSRFVIDGYTVLARPGETTIREGNRARTVEDVTVGRQVHVKGEWVTGEGSAQEVLAWEIKLQDDDDDDDGIGETCRAGDKAEVEGRISAIEPGLLTVNQQGKGLFLCEVSEGTRIRKGNTEYTFDDLQIGWRVHVKGTKTGFEGDVCGVRASEVKVQQT